MRARVLTLLLAVPIVLSAQDDKPDVASTVDALRARAEETALQIWNYAEVGYQEARSSALLQQQLK